MSKHKVLILSAVLLTLSIVPASAQRRCGWIENPSSANWWVSDKDGQWILATQGQPETPGMDLMPDFSTHDWVASAGSHGYGCACVDGTFDANKVATAITAFRQLPLATCKRDASLPTPGQ